MTEPESRTIELEVEVAGTPEEVWRAIATGPGISSWFVPTTVVEEAGGAVLSTFGPAEEMQVEGRVAAWEPPWRVLFAGGAGADSGLAFEWLVEARAGGACVVRLVNSGFASGQEWDDQYDGMTEGWKLFLHNLQLHLAHFPGQEAVAVLPLATWAGPAREAWQRLAAELGIPATVSPGARIEVGDSAPRLAGTAQRVTPTMVSLLLDHPAPGTGFLAVEGDGEQVSTSVWLYLYGDEREAVARRDEPAWRAWLEARAG